MRTRQTAHRDLGARAFIALADHAIRAALAPPPVAIAGVPYARAALLALLLSD